MKRFLVYAAFFSAMGAPAWASTGASDPLPSVLLGLAVVMVAARLGAHLASKAGQPPVLGELLAGVALGAGSCWGSTWCAQVIHDPVLQALAGIGVCLLLFEVGLESTVADMRKVGVPALLVACVGVVAPFVLGWLTSLALLPDQSPYVHAFLGAALTATSVGITARVLQDTRTGQSAEARIILGAAVIDDVLGLVILALVTGAVQAAGSGAGFSLVAVVPIVVKAFVFLAAYVAAGQALAPRLFSWAHRLHGHRVHLVVGLAWCFLGAYLASAAGLAPIVGAYAAGLVLEPGHLHMFHERGEPHLEELLHGVSSFLVPVFFVLMGMQVDVRAFANIETLKLAAGLLAAAFAGKLLCALVVPAGVDGVTVALGMVPRGEVGLIFANAGLALFLNGHRLLDEQAVSALVVVVIVTTIATPPALRWAVSRRQAESSPIPNQAIPQAH